MRLKWRYFLPGTATQALLWLCLLLAESVQAQVIQDSVSELGKIDVVEHRGDKIPLSLTFTNDQGQEVKLSQYFNDDKPVILVLAYYTCPMLCTLVLNGLVNGLADLGWIPGEKFTVLTVSIDPTETAKLAADKKARYLENYGKPEAAAGWHFFVSEESQVKALAKSIGFKYFYDEKRKEYAHPAVITVLTEDGTISRYLYGLEYKASDLKLSLLEASEGRIGSPVDKLLLYCYHYDPDAGSYTLFAANVMRLGGAVTLALLVLVLAALWWRERRRKAAGRAGAAE